MTVSWDAIVVGLGTAGAAAAMELARRGSKVVGFDALRPPHDCGSHHGETRSIRRAYLEGTAYVPMAVRAWTLWRKLEADVGKTLLVSTPNLTIGPEDAPAVTGFFTSAKTYRIPFEALTAADVRRRWPQLNPPVSFSAGLEIEAGILFPERCIAAMLSEAQKFGADLHFGERVVGWEEGPGHVAVKTETGRTEAGRLLIAAGARNKILLGEAGRFLSPKRVPVHWVAPPDGRVFSLGTYPVNFWQIPKSEGKYTEFYSLPTVGITGRVKVALHNDLADCDPDAMSREVSPAERDTMAALVGAYLPALAGQDMQSRLCLYTLTPDKDFILGPVPGSDRVFTAALAGHGFKFAPVLGEMLADQLLGRPPAFDTAMFSPARFG